MPDFIQESACEFLGDIFYWQKILETVAMTEKIFWVKNSNRVPSLYHTISIVILCQDLKIRLSEPMLKIAIAIGCPTFDSWYQ